MATMTVTINTADKRDVRALRILQGARGWTKGTVKIPGVGTRKVYGVPSESEPDLYHLVNQRQCSCPDFQNRQPVLCSHIRAVRWYVKIVLQERRQHDLRQQAEAARVANEAAELEDALGLVDAF